MAYSRKYLENQEQFERTMIILYDWARIWHAQAGSYTASDTLSMLMRAEGYVNEMIDHNPKMEAFRRSTRSNSSARVSLLPPPPDCD